jgi:hypothetical protein
MEWGVKNEARRGELRAASEMEGLKVPGVGKVKKIEQTNETKGEGEEREREKMNWGKNKGHQEDCWCPLKGQGQAKEKKRKEKVRVGREEEKYERVVCVKEEVQHMKKVGLGAAGREMNL